MTWPVGEFDELQRLRVLHAAMPGTMLAETVLAAPLADVWTVLADVETAVTRGWYRTYAPSGWSTATANGCELMSAAGPGSEHHSTWCSGPDGA